MLEIKTDYGVFGSFKDLLIFVKNEGIKELPVRTYYVFDKVLHTNLTVKDIENIIDWGVVR